MELVAAWDWYQQRCDMVEMAAALGAQTDLVPLGDMPYVFVEWSRDFIAMEGRLRGRRVQHVDPREADARGVG